MRRQPAKDVVSDQRGAYQTEYTVVLVLVAVVAAVAIAALSLPLLEYTRSIVDSVVSPAP